MVVLGIPSAPDLNNSAGPDNNSRGGKHDAASG